MAKLLQESPLSNPQTWESKINRKITSYLLIYVGLFAYVKYNFKTSPQQYFPKSYDFLRLSAVSALESSLSKAGVWMRISEFSGCGRQLCGLLHGQRRGSLLCNHICRIIV